MKEYGSDRVGWAGEQAELLRRRDGAGVDSENVARVIEQLGTADVAQLRERIRILLTALVRWAYDVDIRSAGLRITIYRQRSEIERLLDDSPSLRPLAIDLVAELYPEARRAAAMESGPFEDDFSAGLPFLPKEVFDLDFLPDPLGDDRARAGVPVEARRTR